MFLVDRFLAALLAEGLILAYFETVIGRATTGGEGLRADLPFGVSE